MLPNLTTLGSSAISKCWTLSPQTPVLPHLKSTSHLQRWLCSPPKHQNYSPTKHWLKVVTFQCHIPIHITTYPFVVFPIDYPRNRNCKHRHKWVGKLESIVLIRVTLPPLDKIPFLHDRLAQCAFFNKFTTCKSKNSIIKFNIIKKKLDYYSKSHKKPHIPPWLNVLDPNYFSQEGKKIRMSQIQTYKYG